MVFVNNQMCTSNLIELPNIAVIIVIYSVAKIILFHTLLICQTQLFPQQCINCEEEDQLLYKGTRYQCHYGSDEHRRQHNQMCYRCASGVDDLDCPIHFERVFVNYSI